MTTLEQQATAPPDVATRMLQAIVAHDLDAMLATLAPNVVLNSPITGRVAFHGHQEMRELMRAHFATVKDIRYFADARHGRLRATLARLLFAPLALATRLGERVVPWFS
ncbi:MAG TPA: nuclear transport factor 2 family protein [Solirubrobacteraceae bacterium]|nr:nuclear transport factor 2 family protein [Solirubrobacteraceae bacterium]